MKTLQDMQKTRVASDNLGLLTGNEIDGTAGFVYYNHFYIYIGVEQLTGSKPEEADCFAIMYYCDVFNEGIKSRDLHECEAFLYDHIVKDEVQ